MPFPVKPGARVTAHILASQCLQKIYSNPALEELIKSHLVYMIDELSVWSEQLLSAFNIVLQRLHNSPRPFGGCLVIGQ